MLIIQYSVAGLSKDQVDFAVTYISRFVERGFPYKRYEGDECGSGRVGARVDTKKVIIFKSLLRNNLIKWVEISVRLTVTISVFFYLIPQY